MLEILAIWYLSKKVGEIVESKGYKRGWFVVLTIALWFSGEIIGAVVGSIVISSDESNQFIIYLFAIGGAAIGAGISYLIANSLPLKEIQSPQPVIEDSLSTPTMQTSKELLADEFATSQESTKHTEAMLPIEKQHGFFPREPQDSTSVLELFGAGLVLPCFSPTFYYNAARRGLAIAIAFFFFFSLIITGLQSADIVINTLFIRDEINQAFSSGEVPEVHISNGEATIKGPEPFVLIDENRSLVVLDTTGDYTSSDLITVQYDTGFLLTKNKVYMFDRSEGGLTQSDLSDLNAIFGDPIEINAEIVQTWFALIQVIVFIALAFWNSIVRLIYIVLIGILLWGITAVLQRDKGYRVVLIIGLYAVVPAIYADYLLKRLGINFCGLYTFLLLIVWSIGLASALAERNGGLLGSVRPLRTWRALIGAPMLIILGIDVLFTLPSGTFIIWLTVLLTSIVFVIISLRTSQKSEQLA